MRKREEGLVYLIRQNCQLLITTPFSQRASQPHPATVNMERRASQSPQRSLSSNGRIKTVQSDFLCLHGRSLKELNLFSLCTDLQCGGSGMQLVTEKFYMTEHNITTGGEMNRHNTKNANLMFTSFNIQQLNCIIISLLSFFSSTHSSCVTDFISSTNNMVCLKKVNYILSR